MTTPIERLSVGLRIDHQNPGHTHFDVFVGGTPHTVDDLDWSSVTRGNSGTLTLRTPEFDALVGALQATASLASDIHLDVYRCGEPMHEPDPCAGVEYMPEREDVIG